MFKKLIWILSLAVSCAAPSTALKEYRLEVVNTYPHDRDAYTQGLFFHDGRLYETTGQYGTSSIRIVDLESGKPVKRVDIGEQYFIEGSVVFDDKLYVLTWTNHVAFIYDKDALTYIYTKGYSRQGCSPSLRRLQPLLQGQERGKEKRGERGPTAWQPPEGASAFPG